jgi:hypothetical protein
MSVPVRNGGSGEAMFTQRARFCVTRAAARERHTALGVGAKVVPDEEDLALDAAVLLLLEDALELYLGGVMAEPVECLIAKYNTN